MIIVWIYSQKKIFVFIGMLSFNYTESKIVIRVHSKKRANNAKKHTFLQVQKGIKNVFYTNVASELSVF